MKKILYSIVISIAVIFSLCLSVNAAYLGDVNGDGNVLASDARTILRHAASLEKISDLYVGFADVNSDGDVTAADARLALRMSANLDALIDVCQHEYSITESKDSDCVNKGIKKYVCSLCGKEKTQEIDAKGHNYKSVITKAATCGSTGVKTYTCSNCGDTYTEKIEIQDEHKYTSVITKQSTCGSTGVKTYTCSGCGNTYTEKIPIKGEHSYKSTVTKEATYEESGETTYTCYVCGDKYTEEISALKETNPVYIHLPETPITATSYSYFSYMGYQLDSSFKVSDITYELNERSNGAFNITIYISGERLGGQSSLCIIGYKLYDKYGYIIDSGKLLINDISVGEKVKDRRVYINDVEPGEYELEIIYAYNNYTYI